MITQSVESTALPLNARLLSVRLRGGAELVFARAAEDRTLYFGPGSWRAVARPEHHLLNVLSPRAGFTNEYCFLDGRLRFMTEGRRDFVVVTPEGAAPTNALASYWPTAATHRAAGRAVDLWGHSGRLRLFSKNPNRSALVIVELFLLAFALLCRGRSRVRLALSLLVAAAGLALAVATGSRGGVLAFLAGTVPVIFFRWPPHRLGWRTLLLSALLAVLAGAVAYGLARANGSTARERNISTSSRLHMWREVPRMLAAAPWGWGAMKSGPAYNAWFERPERLHMTSDLFNDHLSFVAEGGFAFGSLYVFVWLLALALAADHARRGGSAAALAVFVACAVASSFSPMLRWKPSLIVPGLVAVGTLLAHLHRRMGGFATLYRPISKAIAGTLAILAFSLIFVALAPEQDVPLKVSALGRRVVVGRGEPKVWIADDGFVLCGDYYGFPGKELREFYRDHPSAESVGLVERLEDLPDKVDRLVVTGSLCDEFLADPDRHPAGQTIFYSPPFGLGRIPADLCRKRGIEVLTGSFAARLADDVGRRHSWYHVVPGAFLYIPGWAGMVIGREDSE